MEEVIVAQTIEKVREFALAKHGEQKRKYDGAPYIQHLDNVAGILVEHGYDDPTLIAAALLHDTVEDTPTTVQELVDEFGEEIAELVYWLTDTEKGNRKARALQSAWRLARAPRNAKLIKLADIIDNGSTIMKHDPKFGPVFLAEKRLILQKMDESERGRLKKIPLFVKAALVTEATAVAAD
jgi:(p)ppGpp synthase/HD superfamily hydrolase